MKNITYLVLAVLLGISGIAQSSVEVSEDEYVVFYHHDVLGSPVAVTDDQGRVLWNEHSQPYGKDMGRKNTDGEGFKDNAIEEASSRMGYTGHTVDNTADLVYMKARYYDPAIGRFYSNDPVGFTTANPMMFNRYAYANNNPYLYTDPTGENGVTAVGGAIVETSDAIGGFFIDTFGFGWGDGSADWGNVANALADGYDGNGDGFGSALADDALTFVPVGAAIGAVSKIGKLATRLTKSFRATKSVNLASPQRTKHILYGDATGGGHKFGLTRLFNGKSKFPATWSKDRIMNAVSEVATNPANNWVQQTGKPGSLFTRAGDPVKFKVEGAFGGVNMRVIVQGDDIITAFPIK